MASTTDPKTAGLPHNQCIIKVFLNEWRLSFCLDVLPKDRLVCYLGWIKIFIFKLLRNKNMFGYPYWMDILILSYENKSYMREIG